MLERTAAGVSGAHASAPVAGRVLLLDLLRWLAAFQMVQGHTIDGLLAPQYRHGALHALWLGSRGLTSVAFLVVAGLAFGVGMQHAPKPWPMRRARAVRRLGRAALFVGLGYALHLPLGWPGATAADRAALLASAYAVDILQCTGVSLAALELLALLLPSPRALRLACGVIALLLLGAAPALSQLPVTGPFAALLAYVSPRSGSLFCLSPWAAHLFAGVALQGVLLPAQGRAPRLLLAAGVCFALGFALRHAGVPLPADHLTRLGWVWACAAVLCGMEARAASWPSWVLRPSRETLFLYLFHVLLVYGDRLGLVVLVGQTLAPVPSMLCAGWMVALSFAAALGRGSAQRALLARCSAMRAALAGTTATG